MGTRRRALGASDGSSSLAPGARPVVARTTKTPSRNGSSVHHQTARNTPRPGYAHHGDSDAYVPVRAYTSVAPVRMPPTHAATVQRSQVADGAQLHMKGTTQQPVTATTAHSSQNASR